MRIRAICRGLALLLLASGIAGEAAGQAGQEPRAVIVLDGSGSMWGKLGKEVKFYAARDALKQSIPKARAQVGLVSFSHRRADCTDSELVVATGSTDPERFAATLDKLNPRGKGPVAAALKTAAEALDGRQGGSIIVIADNADNCKVDACEAAVEIKDARPNVVAHVIALGPPKEELPQLACIATTTGGKVFRLENGSEIVPALDEALRLAAGPARVPTAAPAAAATAPVAVAPPKKEAPPPVGPPGLRLAAVLKSGGEALGAGVRWRVLPAGADPKATDAKVIYESEEPSPTVAMKPGRYLVEVRYGLVEARQTVEAAEKGPTPAEVVLNAGIIRINGAAGSAGTSRERAFTTLYRATDKPGDRPPALAMSSDPNPVYSVPAGSYLVVVQHGLSRTERSLAIAPGALAEIDMPLYLGELKLAASATEGGPPLDRVFFLIYEDDPDAPDGVREVARSGAREPELTLPAGTYYVVARHGAAEARERLSLKPGTRIAKTLVLASGRLSLGSRLAGRGQLDPDLVSYRVERLTGAARPGQPAERQEIARSSLPDPVLTLTAGRYRIESRYGPANARVAREIDIRAGSVQSLNLEHEAGLVRLRLVDPARGQGVTDVFWEIADGAGRAVWSTGQATPILALAAGRYVVRAEHREQRYEQTVQLGSGEDKTIEIVAK